MIGFQNAGMKCLRRSKTTELPFIERHGIHYTFNFL